MEYESIDDRILRMIRETRKQRNDLSHFVDMIADTLNSTGGETETKKLIATKLFDEIIKRIA